MATTRLKCRFSFFAFFLLSDLEQSVSLGCIWKSRVWFRIGTQFLVGFDQRLWSRTKAAYADLVQSFWAHHACEFTKGSCSVWHWISHRLRSPYITVANSSWISTRCSRKLFEHISFLNRSIDWNLVSRSAQRILHIGLCLPTSCSNEQIADLSQEYFDSEVLDAQNVLEQHPKVLEAKDLKLKTDFMQKGTVKLMW